MRGSHLRWFPLQQRSSLVRCITQSVDRRSHRSFGGNRRVWASHQAGMVHSQDVRQFQLVVQVILLDALGFFFELSTSIGP